MPPQYTPPPAAWSVARSSRGSDAGPAALPLSRHWARIGATATPSAGTRLSGSAPQAQSDAPLRPDSPPLWVDCLADFDAAAIAAAGADPDDLFFRGLAYRMMWKLSWDPGRDRIGFHVDGVRGPADEPTADQLALFTLYARVEPWLQARTILPGETGVLYRAGERSVLWSFAAQSLPLAEERRVTDLLAGDAAATATLVAGRRRVYLIEPSRGATGASGGGGR